MKAASPALIAFLLDAQEFVRVDLYTFTLIGGGVLRYCSASLPVSSGGFTWNVGPPIQDGGVQSSRGVSASSVDITVLGDERWLVNGEQFLDFVENFGLDGATVRIDRAFAASWLAMSQTGPIGAYCRFLGRFSEAKELGQTQVVIAATSYLDALSTDFPKEMYQTSCINAFGDANCGVNLAALTVTGTVQNTGETYTDFQSTLDTQPSDYFELGVVDFTSGVNAGVSRSVKAYDVEHGTFSVVAPLPGPPVAGDTFTACPGCKLSIASCQQFQPSTWMQRFRGAPLIPPPSTGLPT